MLLLGFGNKARQGKDLAAEAIKHYYEAGHDNGYMASPVRVGVFKFATALYQEVNDFLSIFDERALPLLLHRIPLPINSLIQVPEQTGIVFDASQYEIGTKMIQIPDWVTLDPNPEISELAPYGKHPKLLQWWGTEYRRAQNPYYWTDKLFSSIPANLDVALVTDVRFPNEFIGVKERGGYCVNVTRLREDGVQYFSSDRPSGHLSETALDTASWDFKLVNSANHQALLAEQAITLCEYLRALGPSK